MTMHPLDRAFAKIKRAETHIQDLQFSINAFIERNPYRLISEVNADGTQEVWSFQIDCLDEAVETIAADAIHNLRVPLDKMLTVGAPEGILRQIKFPTGPDKDKFERSLANQKKHLAGPVIEFLETTEAYAGGKGDLLFALHDIDNSDKHHAIVVPIKLGNLATKVESIQSRKGDLVMIGSKRGAHMVPSLDESTGQYPLVAPSGVVGPIYREVKGECWLEFWGPLDDMEVFTTTPGAKLNIDIKPTVTVAFSQIKGFEHEPVVAVLHQMREAVHRTLVAFRDRFF